MKRFLALTLSALMLMSLLATFAVSAAETGKFDTGTKDAPHYSMPYTFDNGETVIWDDGARHTSEDGKWQYRMYRTTTTYGATIDGWCIATYKGTDNNITLPETIDGHSINAVSAVLPTVVKTVKQFPKTTQLLLL